jgi:hypothetical protein
MAKRSREEFVGTAGTETSTEVDQSAEVLSGEILPLDLQTYTGPLYARNNTSAIISFDDKGIYFRIGNKGSNEDLVVLPLEAAKHHEFQKLWRTGKVTVTTDPAMEQALILAATSSEQLKAGQIASDIMEEPGDKKNLVSMKCLISGETVWQTQAEVDGGKPPLIDYLEDQAFRFVSEAYQDEEGNQKFRFIEVKTTV